MAVWICWRTVLMLVCLTISVILSTQPGFARNHEVHSQLKHPANSFGVFGIDTLKPVPHEYDAVKRSIGRLRSKNGQTINCTVFCVAPDIVATASHCLFTAGPSGRRPELTSFDVELEENQVITRTKIAGEDEKSVRWNVLAGTTEFPSRSPLENTRDWALLKLASSSCNKGSLQISKKTKKRDLMEAIFKKQVFTIGYMRRGEALKLSFSGKCQTRNSLPQLEKVWATIDNMFVDAEDLIPHRCDFRPGASGSPLFLQTPEGPIVIALNNGTIPVPKRILVGKSPKERQALIRAIPTATNLSVSTNALVKQIAFMRLSTGQLSHENIKRLQLMLKSLGHYDGPIDGHYGVLLRQAILDFERNEKLLVTGLPALSLLRAFK